MTQKTSPGAGEKAQPLYFHPACPRARHDGWTARRQVDFIRALSECGCVRDACRRVGMSAESAYALARRPDAQSFRMAWEYALDSAIRRMGDEAFSRAIHGVAVPHYYKGELVGEHRRYNDRLVQFLLRYRDPHLYGRHLDRTQPRDHRERSPLMLAEAMEWMYRDAVNEAKGRPRRVVTKVMEIDPDEA